jgi:hypothetical protein
LFFSFSFSFFSFPDFPAFDMYSTHLKEREWTFEWETLFLKVLCRRRRSEEVPLIFVSFWAN